MNIKSTTYPDQVLEQNEWMETFKVSSQVPKYDGIERARQMMAMWGRPLAEERSKETILDRLIRWFSGDII